MDNVQKAAMLAVKKIGACWRCKILRKTVRYQSLEIRSPTTHVVQCDPDSPCQNCPKSKKQSFWHSVGCKRGTIVDKVARTLLCPNADKPARRPSSPERRREAKEVKRKNKEVRRVTEERNIQVNGEDTRGIFHNWLLEQARHPDQIQVEDALTSDMTQLQPLVQCTLAIEWEIKEIGSGDGPHISIWRQFIHEMYPWYPKFGLLLHSAATYQAFTQQVKLQGFIWLSWR
jgi:hypothetical protein